ncbi:MAG: hypothetical protein Q8O46_01360 [bacterium]|nr:hypothetical protein [bacterium]
MRTLVTVALIAAATLFLGFYAVPKVFPKKSAITAVAPPATQKPTAPIAAPAASKQAAVPAPAPDTAIFQQVVDLSNRLAVIDRRLAATRDSVVALVAFRDSVTKAATAPAPTPVVNPAKAGVPKKGKK